MPVANPLAQLSPINEAPGRLPLGVRVVNILAVVLPFVGFGLAVLFLWGWGFSWVELGLLLGMYVSTALGITVG